jgi:threonine dehydratase
MKQESTKNMQIEIYGLSEIITMAYDASSNLPGYIVNSPIIEYTFQDSDGLNRTVYVKDETVQPGHSFKDRGSAYAIGRYVLNGVESVVTASAGNHGLGVARAAKYYGIESTVVVPESSEQIKKDTIRELGARLIEISGDFSDAEFVAKSITGDRNIQLIHPFADPFVAAGQGSIAVEVLDQLSGDMESYVPVGGGGLLLGYGSLMKAYSKGNDIIGCQPKNANTYINSYSNNLITVGNDIDSEFGGLAVRNLDPRTFSLGTVVTDRCVELDSIDIYRTIHEWRERFGQILEPAAAVGLTASFKKSKESIDNKKIVTIVTGSNSSKEVLKKVDKLAIENKW